MQMAYDIYQSPIGPIGIVVDENGVKKIELFEEEWKKYLALHPTIEHNPESCRGIRIQLEEYFDGRRKNFTVPLSYSGTKFMEQVWRALQEIPYGETKSYSDIAIKIGNPKAVRAIGQANKRNELPIIIPCHRVIGKNGTLTGYAGDRTSVKEVLLQLEKKQL